MTLAPSSRLAGYNTGYVFFTHAHDRIASGIDWFQRFGRGENLPVHHTGIVVDSAHVEEAHWRSGVRKAHLPDYLADPDTLIVFRRPRGWTPELGQRIAQAALSRDGRPYNKGLILSQLASNTFLGHLLNGVLRGMPEVWLCRMLDNRQAFICSQLSAWALNEQPEFKGRGILSAPLDTITPQELYDDPVLWEPCWTAK